MKRHASARWDGNLKEGHGTISTKSEAIMEMPYSFTSRFEDGKGTNPEELIGAAHAGCFSMALANNLSQAGWQPVSIESSATVTLEKQDGQWTIQSSHLSVDANVPGIDENELRGFAEDAKTNCPVSRLLNAQLTLDIRLKNQTRPDVDSQSTSAAY